MVAQKSDTNATAKKKFVIGASLPQRSSKEDRELLLNLKPSKKMQELMPSQKVKNGRFLVL